MPYARTAPAARDMQEGFGLTSVLALFCVAALGLSYHHYRETNAAIASFQAAKAGDVKGNLPTALYGFATSAEAKKLAAMADSNNINEQVTLRAKPKNIRMELVPVPQTDVKLALVAERLRPKVPQDAAAFRALAKYAILRDEGERAKNCFILRSTVDVRSTAPSSSEIVPHNNVSLEPFLVCIDGKNRCVLTYDFTSSTALTDVKMFADAVITSTSRAQLGRALTL